MKDIITIGDALIAFNPVNTGPMRFSELFAKRVGGAELNVAIGCSRLGLTTGWLSRLGNDEFGKHILNFARGEGVDVSQVQLVDGYPTSLTFKEIKENGNVNTFYYREKSPILSMTPESLDEEYLRKAKILHITGIFPAINPENNLPIIKQSIKLAKKHGVKVSFDPNIRLKLWSQEEAKRTLSEILPDVDILLAGDEEMDIILGIKEPNAIIEACKSLDISYIAIKMGAKGSLGYHNGKVIEIPAVNVDKVVDTIGAGDGFNAGVLYGIVNDWPLDKTLNFANRIGSMVVGVKGDNEGLPYYDEVQEQLGEKKVIER
ncbi:sugar kinase [Virgibacillus ainsalahensis]